MFATWVWDMAGVPAVDSSVRETYAARELGLYGRNVWGTWHRTAPKRGDWTMRLRGWPAVVVPGVLGFGMIGSVPRSRQAWRKASLL
jgi:hypothetical protein